MVFLAEIHKIHKRLVRIANKEAPDQTASLPDINQKLVLKKKLADNKKKACKITQ